MCGNKKKRKEKNKIKSSKFVCSRWISWPSLNAQTTANYFGLINETSHHSQLLLSCVFKKGNESTPNTSKIAKHKKKKRGRRKKERRGGEESGREERAEHYFLFSGRFCLICTVELPRRRSWRACRHSLSNQIACVCIDLAAASLVHVSAANALDLMTNRLVDSSKSCDYIVS